MVQRRQVSRRVEQHAANDDKQPGRCHILQQRNRAPASHAISELSINLQAYCLTFMAPRSGV